MRRARRPRMLGATTQTRARSDPRPARVCDRAPAPPAPLGPRHSACGADRGQAAGLAGLCVTSYASARVWPASRRGRIYGHEYLGLLQCLTGRERAADVDRGATLLDALDLPLLVDDKGGPDRNPGILVQHS